MIRRFTMDVLQFNQSLAKHHLHLTKTELEQFSTYYTLLIDWNKHTNLTAITDKSTVYLKHFYDSLTASFYIDFTNVETICDVGAGAGFPSIPLKICFPHLHVTIIDRKSTRLNSSH